jgi:hypothetical protein
LSSHEPAIWIALAAATKIDEIEVNWPAGMVQRWGNLDVDKLYEIVEGSREFRRLERSNAPPPVRAVGLNR